MAYQVTRKNRIKEILQLCNADGSVAHTLAVDLNVDEIAARVNKVYDTLGMAQNALRDEPNSPKLVEAYGEAVTALFRVIFGDEGAETLLSFYEGNYTEMLLDMFPFINEIVMPQIREASAARREQLVEAARAAQQNGEKKRGWRK